MAGAGYDIGVSVSGSSGSGLTDTGSISVTDNSSLGGSKNEVIIIGVLVFLGLFFWLLLRKDK